MVPDAELLDQERKWNQDVIDEDMFEVSNPFICPSAEVQWLFIADEVRVVPDRGEK